MNDSKKNAKLESEISAALSRRGLKQQWFHDEDSKAVIFPHFILVMENSAEELASAIFKELVYDKTELTHEPLVVREFASNGVVWRVKIPVTDLIVQLRLYTANVKVHDHPGRECVKEVVTKGTENVSLQDARCTLPQEDVIVEMICYNILIDR